MGDETPEPEPAFYQWDAPRWFGNLKFHWVAGGLYMLWAFIPAIAHFGGMDAKELIASKLTIPWAFVTAVTYPLWTWLEFRGFEEWVRELPAPDRIREREYFASVTAKAHDFWTSILATYTIAGVWQLTA